MVVPEELKKKILSEFDAVIAESTELIPIIQQEDQAYDASIIDGYDLLFEVHDQSERVYELQERAVTLIELVLTNSERRKKKLVDQIESASGSAGLSLIAGRLKGLKRNFENGLLDDLSQMITANLTVDYLQQATELLSEGQSGKYDHIPATVLAGAVLENALRNLCERNGIEILKEKGGHKTLDPLITDLQKANVINKAKATMLKSWAQIRNSAAHGHFDEVDASEVPAMIEGINKFIADFM